MREILFSVIVPVYNAEKTIHRCVDSLLNQVDGSVEIILVDDGSSDNSCKICAEYAEKYEGVILIHKANGGVSTARNVGLNTASGKYVLFVDSDDFVSERLFSVLKDSINQAWDCIHFSNFKVSNGLKQERLLKPEQVFEGNDLANKIAEMICKKTINSPWAKAFRREIISRYQIRFPENLSLGEDKVFNLRFMLNCRSYTALNDPLYYVCVDSENSLSRKVRPDLIDQMDGSLMLCRKALLESNMPEEQTFPICKALNYMELRSVYTMAKEYRKEGLPFISRMKNIHELASSVVAKDYQYPTDIRSKIITKPVIWNFGVAIDLFARVLLR